MDFEREFGKEVALTNDNCILSLIIRYINQY